MEQSTNLETLTRKIHKFSKTLLYVIPLATLMFVVGTGESWVEVFKTAVLSGRCHSGRLTGCCDDYLSHWRFPDGPSRHYPETSCRNPRHGYLFR